jgi:hypothetical protein
MKTKIFLIATAILLQCSVAVAQIPVELFVGDKKTTLDIMFFKFIKNKEQQNTNWLFFNRNRASIDYKMTTTTDLPVFGFTQAISYNHKKLKGFAPVVVAQISNRGIYPKAGIQFFHRKKDFTFFSWVVSETLKNPNLDLFVLTRYEPRLTEKLHLFTQLELVNAFPTIKNNNFTFVQRVRLGLKIKAFQFGAGSDFSSIGRNDFLNTINIGGFIRYEF